MEYEIIYNMKEIETIYCIAKFEIFAICLQ